MALTASSAALVLGVGVMIVAFASPGSHASPMSAASPASASRPMLPAGPLGASVSQSFTTGSCSTMRLQQLLAQLGYLPFTWTPSSGSVISPVTVTGPVA